MALWKTYTYYFCQNYIIVDAVNLSFLRIGKFRAVYVIEIFVVLRKHIIMLACDSTTLLPKYYKRKEEGGSVQFNQLHLHASSKLFILSSCLSFGLKSFWFGGIRAQLCPF